MKGKAMKKKLLALVAGVVLLATVGMAERADIYVERGAGYFLLYSQNEYVVGFGSANPTIRGAFGSSGHVIPDGRLFYRTDTGSWQTPSAGSFTTATFSLTGSALVSPTISGTVAGGATYTAPVITDLATDPTTTVNVGTEAVTNMTVTENGDGAVHKTIFTFAAHSVTMTDAGAAGSHGSVPIYTFSQGFIKIHTSFCNLATLAGAGGIADDAALVLSMGSVVVATDNATLTGTEADLLASFAGTLSSGAGVFTKDGTTVAALFDGHTTSEAIFLNLAVPDANSTASDTIALTGSCAIIWSNAGDF